MRQWKLRENNTEWWFENQSEIGHLGDLGVDGF
jgi:hypothetical protein